MELRRGNAGDLNAVAALYDALNDHLARHVNYPGWRKGVYPIREDAARGIAERTLFVLEDAGAIAGTVILNHEPEEGYALADWGGTEDYGRVLVVRTLAVHPGWLRRGVGRALLEFALELARETGMEAVRLDVYEQNAPAQRLYEALGFRYVASVDLGYGAYGLDRFALYQFLPG